MKLTITVPLAALALAACNQGPSVSLTNASPEEAAKAIEASGAGQAQMRPGKWESKIEVLEMEMPGMEGMPPEFAQKMKTELMKARTVSTCMTEDDLKQRNSKIFTGDKNNKCTFDRYNLSGGKIDAVMTCPGDRGTMKMQMTGTFAAESYALEQSMDMAGPDGKNLHSKSRVSGKRIGDCAAGEK
jgi:hypothetical protein